MKLIRSLIATCLCLSYAVVHASDSHLYEVTLPVADQSNLTADHAVQQAGAIVVSRLTGQLTLDRKTKRESRLRAKQWVSRYRYLNASSTTEPKPADEEDSSEQTDHSPETKITISFNKKSVLSYLESTQMSIWSPQRPTLLLWLWRVTPDQQVESEDGSWLSTSDEIADRAGLPLIHPSQTHVEKYADQLNEQEVVDWQSASDLYHPDLILVGTVDEPSQSIRWQLWSAQSHIEWQAPLSQPEFDIKQADQRVIDHLKALDHWQDDTPQAEQRISLQFTQIPSLRVYARICRFLDQDDATHGWQLLSYRTDAIEVKVTVTGETEAYLAHLQANLPVKADGVSSADEPKDGDADQVDETPEDDAGDASAPLQAGPITLRWLYG